MLGTGAVYEFTGKVANPVAMEEHPHSSCCSNICNVGNLYIVCAAKGLEGSLVFSLYYNGHTLLGLADSKFSGIEAGIFDGHAVKIDIQAVCKLANSNAHATGAKVVALLNKAGYLRAAEESLELALLGGVTLLNLASAGLK